MIKKKAKRLLACGLSIALVASSLSSLPSQNAAAAKKASVKLAPAKVSIKVGKTKKLKVKKTNVKKIKSTKWSTNKKKVATVNKKGKITAKSVGSAKITAKVKYIPKGKKKAVTKKLICKVTVKAATVTPSADPSTNPAITTPSTQPAVSAAPSAIPSAAPEVTPTPASNIGAAHEITQSDGTVLTIKDNGSIRKDVTAQYIADNEMKTGINLGNTMEATWSLDYKRSTTLSRTDYDKAWSQPETTRAYIECLHSYGINTLRIPVAWSNGDKDDGTYTIDPILLDRVEEIANWALDLGMYVVINDHWDNQWWGQFGACKFETDEDGTKTKVVDQETRDAAWARYERYWTQIAERFKGYSDHLIFEGANEELGDRLNDVIVITDDYKGYAKPDNSTKETLTCSGNLTTDECYEMTNKINQKFVDIIRGTGGNNANRFLLIPGYNTNIDATGSVKDEDGNYKFQMPTDTSENGKNKLFLSVHYYNPTSYALDGGSGEYTEEDRAKVPEYFEPLARFNDEGYAIIIGECAVCEPSDVTGGVIDWYTDVFTEAAKYHAVPVVWDTGANFDRTAPSIYYKDMADFWNSWNNANGSTEGVTRETGGGQVAPGGDVTVPDYIDQKLWASPKIHGYLFYQTSTWNYRDAYTPLMNLGKDKHSWDFVSTATEETVVTDTDITEDGMECTVSIDNFVLSGNSFKMLGVSTNINKSVYKDLNIRATATSIKCDGVELLEEPKELVVKTDDKYYDLMAINVYDKGVPQEDYALGALNANEQLELPTQSLEITFTLEGIQPVLDDIASGEWVNPETGLKIKDEPAA